MLYVYREPKKIGFNKSTFNFVLGGLTVILRNVIVPAVVFPHSF